GRAPVGRGAVGKAGASLRCSSWAGLTPPPADLLEAAALDGADAWQRFRHVTWPLLTPTTLFLLITLTVASFQGFDIVRIMTQGGPVTSTVIYVYYIY